MKLNRKNSKEEDYDFNFDFSQYNTEETEKTFESLKKWRKPQASLFRSRFNNGESELFRLAELNQLLSKYAIEVGMYTQSRPDIVKFFAILSEVWAIIKPIFGQQVEKEVGEKLKIIKKEVTMKREGKIPEIVHDALLEFRDELYQLKQLANLGFEVEMRGRGTRAQRLIRQ